MKKIAYIAVVALAVASCNKEDAVKIESISVVPETKTLYTDEALPELAVTINPESIEAAVEWTSSDPELVTVSETGVLAFAVKDIEDAEKTVVITATAEGKSATCTLTVKGQIARYEVLDLTETLGVKLLDRNVGAASVTEVGNYYQWGKNTPVAANDDTAVNANYDAKWGPASEGFADWTVAENTPCPKGWSLPNDTQMTAIGNALENIALYDYDFCTKEEYDAACAVLNSMKLVACGQFKNGYTDKKYLSDASYFWSSYTFKDSNSVDKVGTFENNLFPTYSKKSGCSYDVAIPVRCVK